MRSHSSWLPPVDVRRLFNARLLDARLWGARPWGASLGGCNTDEVVVVRWCGEVVERWEHVHVHTHTPHTHRRMS